MHLALIQHHTRQIHDVHHLIRFIMATLEGFLSMSRNQIATDLHCRHDADVCFSYNLEAKEDWPLVEYPLFVASPALKYNFHYGVISIMYLNRGSTAGFC